MPAGLVAVRWQGKVRDAVKSRKVASLPAQDREFRNRGFAVLLIDPSTPSVPAKRVQLPGGQTRNNLRAAARYALDRIDCDIVDLKAHAAAAQAGDVARRPAFQRCRSKCVTLAPKRTVSRKGRTSVFPSVFDHTSRALALGLGGRYLPLAVTSDDLAWPYRCKPPCTKRPTLHCLTLHELQVQISLDPVRTGSHGESQGL